MICWVQAIVYLLKCKAPKSNAVIFRASDFERFQHLKLPIGKDDTDVFCIILAGLFWQGSGFTDQDAQNGIPTDSQYNI